MNRTRRVGWVGGLLAAATATLPTSRRHWGQAMAAELPQIPGPPGAVALRRRLRPHRPPPPGQQPARGGHRPRPDRGRHGSGRPGHHCRPARGAGVRAGPCRAGRLAGHPGRGPVTQDQRGRSVLLASRQELRRAELDIGMMSYLFLAPPVVLLAGSATAAAIGRSFRAGLRACAWAVALAAPPIIAAWLAEALRWHHQRGQLLLDGEGGPGLGTDLVGVNLGDAIWWTLLTLALWALPLGVLGAAAASTRARRRQARERAGLAPSS